MQIFSSTSNIWVGAALILTNLLGTSAQAEGLLDPSFDPGSGPNGFISATAIQSDERIIVAGAFTEFNGAPKNRIARLNSDGSLDSTFDPGTGADDTINALAIQPDGKIVIGGFFTTINGISRNGIARLNTNGSVDTSFDPGTGVTTLTLHPQVIALILKADGKIVIGGYFNTVNGVSRDGIAQLNSDGSVDDSFSPGTGLEGWVALAVAAKTNGQVLIGGIFEKVNGVSIKSIARLNANGSVDATFAAPNGGIGGSNFLERVYAVAVQLDGKVLVGGDFTIISGLRRQHVARLNANGAVDETFDPGILYLDRVSAMALQSDGRVVVGGAFRSIDGVSRSCIARLMPDGSLDLGFDPGAGIQVPPFSPSQPSVETVALQPDGRLVVGGLFDSFDGIPRKNIARLEPGSETNLAIINFATAPVNGSVRENNGPAMITINRIGAHDRVTTVDYSTHDETAKAGEDYSAQSGTVTFAIGERSKTISVPILNDTLPEDDERFQVALTNASSDAALGSISTLDQVIIDDDPGVEFSAPTYNVTEIDKNVTIKVRRVGPIQAPLTVDFATTDGTATAGQDYTAQSGTLRFGYFFNDWERFKTFTIPILDDSLVEGSETIRLALSNPIGGVLGPQSTASVVIDDNDSPAGPGRGANDSVQVILPLADGRAIIGGDFTFVDGLPRNRIARLNADATLDTAFDPGLGADSIVYALALQSDQKILVGGAFTNINGIKNNGVARLNPDGSVDSAFNSGAGVQGSSHGVPATVRSIVLQTNGQILIGGFFSGYAGMPRSGIARLNSDGSLDNAFNPSYGQDAVFPMALQSDGKILAGGYFTVSGYVIEFSRLNSNGSVDETFTLGADQLLIAHVSGIALLNDGKILMDGRFVFRDTNRDFFGVLRFNNDGSIDNTYLSTNVIASYVNSFVLQSDGKLLAGGRAASIPGINPGGMTRLNPDGSLDATFKPTVGSQGDVFAVAVQPAGTILLGGSFRMVNGLPRYRIAKLSSDGTLSGGITFNPPIPMPDGRIHLTAENPLAGELIIEACSNLSNWLPIYTNTARGPLDWIDSNGSVFRQRFYRAVMKQ